MNLDRIQKNLRRSAQIISEHGGYDAFRRAMTQGNDHQLKQEVLEMDKEMENLGIMTIEIFDDPKKRQEFLKKHSSIIIGIEHSNSDY